MTYISRLVLNPERQGARKFLSNPHVMHAAICRSFEEDKMGHHPLWVLDTSRRDPNLFVVSESQPDLTHIVEAAGRMTSPAQTAVYRTLDNVAVGREFLFKVKANPLVKRGRAKIPLVTDEDITQWLLKRAKGFGFELASDVSGNIELGIPRKDVISFRKFDKQTGQKHIVTQNSAILQGKLVVADEDLFRHTLSYGIGANRSYGCGLLLIEG